jgi:hypothetical protein
MRDQYAPGVCRQRQHLWIAYAHQPGRMSGLKLNPGLTPQRGFYDDVVEVGVGLKTHAHV